MRRRPLRCGDRSPADHARSFARTHSRAARDQTLRQKFVIFPASASKRNRQGLRSA
jgi:hypothetical protein